MKIKNKPHTIKHHLLKNLVIWLAGLFIFTFFAGKCFGLPEIDNIASGEITIQTPDAATLRIDASDKAIVNYKSFDIAQNESVIVNLPSVNNEILNRVLGNKASEILGSLSCNGIFILVNQNGIYFGPSAQVDVAGLIASTRDITDQDFLDSRYIFSRLSQEQMNALLLNQGRINLKEGGFGIMIAGAIDNQGTIAAPVGTIALASADMVRIDISPSGAISVAIDQAQASGILDYSGKPITDQIKNTGTLQADEGVVLLKAESVPDIFKAAVNLQGIVQADRLVAKDGAVKIYSSADIKVNAQVSAETIEIGSASEGLPKNVLIEGGTLTAGTGGVTVLAKNDLTTKADITAVNGDINLFADYDGDNLGMFTQSLGTLYATGLGNVFIDGSEEMTLAKIATDYGYIKVGSQRAPASIAGSPYYVHTKGDLTITEKDAGVIKTERGDILRYSPQGSLTLEATNGTIQDLTPTPLSVNYLTLIANSIKATSYSQTTEVYKNLGDLVIEKADPNDNLITLEGEGLRIAYLNSNNLTLKSDNSIRTSPGVIIQATQVKLAGRQFGTSDVPLNINAAITHIVRTSGEINIAGSTGIGTSIMITGPPSDGFGAIIYNYDTNLTLEAQAGSILTSEGVVLYSSTLSLLASQNIGSSKQAVHFTVTSLSTITAQNGSIYLDSNNTDTYIRGNIYAYGNINIYTQEGLIEAKGDNLLIASETGSINLETTTGHINAYKGITLSAPLGTIRIWTSTHMDVAFATKISKDGTIIWNPEDGDTHTWSAAADGNWSVAGNWTSSGGGIPDTDDDVVFDGTSTFKCIINIDTTVASITIMPEYNGWITYKGGGGGDIDVVVTGDFTHNGVERFVVGYTAGDNPSTFTVLGNTTIDSTTSECRLSVWQINTITLGDNPSDLIKIAETQYGNLYTINGGTTIINGTATLGTNGDIFLTINDAGATSTLTLNSGASLTNYGNFRVGCSDHTLGNGLLKGPGTFSGNTITFTYNSETTTTSTNTMELKLENITMTNAALTIPEHPDNTDTGTAEEMRVKVTINDDNCTFDDVTINNRATLSADNHNFAVTGDWTMEAGGIFTPGTGTATFSGSAAQAITGSTTWHNLVIANTGAATVTPSAKQTVEDTLTVTSGTWAACDTDDYNNVSVGASGVLTPASGASISVGGDFDIDGTFNPGTGEVVFDDNSQTTHIYGTTFNDLTCTTAGKELQFEAGSTETINGTLTFTGSDGSPILLRSVTDNSQWNIDPKGTINISYVDVKDSLNLNGVPINPANSIDSGNDIKWFHDQSPPPANIPEPEESQEPPIEEWSAAATREFLFEEGEKFKKNYPKGKYRTVVVVYEGKVLVSPYDEGGLKEGVYLTAGEETEQAGEVK